MSDNKKVEFLEAAMFKLHRFSTSLNDNNSEEFENLKAQIMNILNENEQIRFGQINFYEEQVDFNDIMDDELPF